MKLTRYLLLLPLFAFAADWQPFAVDKRVTVQMPSQPRPYDLTPLAAGNNISRVHMWILEAPEALYTVSRSPIDRILTPHDTLGRRTYYTRVVEALLKDEQGQLVDYAFFSTPAGQGLEFKYKGLHKVTKQRLTKHLRCVVVDTISYMLNFRSTDKTDSLGLAGAEQRRRFFNSITVKP